MERRWLIEVRKAKGLSQKEVCEMASVSQPTYWEYEKGRCSPKVHTAKRIAAILGFDWTRFYPDGEETDVEKVV